MPHGLRASGSFSHLLTNFSPDQPRRADSRRLCAFSLALPRDLLVSCLQRSAHMSPTSRLAVCPPPPPISLVTLFVSFQGAHCDLE